MAFLKGLNGSNSEKMTETALFFKIILTEKQAILGLVFFLKLLKRNL